MDPRFRGDDDNRGKSEGLLPMTQITGETRIALTEINRVIPGPRSGTRNPWGSSLGHELNPMDPRFRGDDDNRGKFVA